MLEPNATVAATMDHQGADLETAMATVVERLTAIVRDGIIHGYFEVTISGRAASGGRTEVIIAAGKKHRFLLRNK
jgi:hypothetical protein